MTYLRKGTVKCPKDGTKLYWETFGLMRLRHENASGRGHHYKTECPKCKKQYLVRAAKGEA